MKQKIKICSISIPQEMYSDIQQRIESGYYGSLSEVVREALRFLIWQDNKLLAALSNKNLESALSLSDELLRNLTARRRRKLSKIFVDSHIAHDFEEEVSQERLRSILASTD